MDRSLDEILAEKAEKRQSSPSRGNDRRGGGGGGRGRRDRDRSDNFPRDGVRKPYREEPRNLDKDWVHDKYEENAPRQSNNRRRREFPEAYNDYQGAKLKIENVHYELTEGDLDELFNRIGPVIKLQLRYDRAGRSEGVAFVIYESKDDALEAIKQFNGANANGQPIRISMMSASRQRNPFDTAVMPGRPLAERITKPRARSFSPDHDVDEAAKKGIDRYIPDRNQTRSPAPQRRREGRRPGTRREVGGTSSDGNGGRGGKKGGTSRPKKTRDELDAEMADYFGGGGGPKPMENTAPVALATVAAPHDDVDMIE